jgi:uncharacterized YccA/Bax inhibitor family protein
MRFRSSNPVFKYGDFSNESSYSATYSGVASKTGFLLAIIALVAMYIGAEWELMFTSFTQLIVILIAAPIIAIISVIVAHKNPAIAWIFSIIYALCEGAFLGIITAIYANIYGGDVVRIALTATFGVFASMLVLYSTGIIRVGTFFRRFMMSMLFGLIGASLLMLILVLFSGGFTGGLYTMYVGIVVVSCIISALYLLIDFDNISNLVSAGAGKEYEWSLSLGLTVTIVWLYIELLRLVAIISRRK